MFNGERQECDRKGQDEQRNSAHGGHRGQSLDLKDDEYMNDDWLPVVGLTYQTVSN